MKFRILKLVRFAMIFATTPAALATTWYVNGVSGNDANNCLFATTACKTIDHAIALASSGDSIRVAAATYSERLIIGINLSVLGADAGMTIIDGGGFYGPVVAISNPSAHVTFSRMTIRNGRGLPTSGGGVLNSGTLTINNSTVSGNLVTGYCYYRYYRFTCINGVGGGIFSSGTLTINNSTVSGNEATGSCFLSHCAIGEGGGVATSGTLTISNSSISGNRANLGSGIYGHATLQNSIVANGGGNCSGAMTSKGYNLSSDTTCNFNGPGDMNNIHDPRLGPLQYNGGPTQTMALQPGSPAIDAGNPSGCTDGQGHLLKTDQRGMPRPNPEDGGGCDMGAYERQSD